MILAGIVHFLGGVVVLWFNEPSVQSVLVGVALLIVGGFMVRVGWHEASLSRENAKKLEVERVQQKIEQEKRAQEMRARQDNIEQERARQEKARQEKARQEKNERRNTSSGNISTFDSHRLILELPEVFTISDVKRQYKYFVAKYHPDKVLNQGEELIEVAEEHTKKLNAAYEYFREMLE